MNISITINDCSIADLLEIADAFKESRTELIVKQAEEVKQPDRQTSSNESLQVTHEMVEAVHLSEMQQWKPTWYGKRTRLFNRKQRKLLDDEGMIRHMIVEYMKNGPINYIGKVESLCVGNFNVNYSIPGRNEGDDDIVKKVLITKPNGTSKYISEFIDKVMLEEGVTGRKLGMSTQCK